jgi:hypothetical protein
MDTPELRDSSLLARRRRLTVPLLGTITIPLGCYPSGGVSFQPGGQPGYAVRRLGGAPLFPYPDAPYLTNFIKGRIGP